MSTTVTMPQLGETVTEGTILSWAKQPGESIAADEVLFEVSTDKVDTEVPSPVTGTVLEILVEAGVTVPVGTPLIVIGEAGEVPAAAGAATPAPPATPATPVAPEPSPPPAPAPEPVAVPQPVAEPVVAAVTPTGEVDAGSEETAETVDAAKFLSPVVRKLAKEHDLDLTKIAGTGRAGRITRNDVLELIDAGGGAAQAAPVRQPTAPAIAPTTPPAAAPTGTGQPFTVMEGDDVRDLDRIRTRIGTNMTLAKQTAAHVWTSVEVDYERVERVRQRHRAAFKEREGFSLTYMPFIARATIDALKAFPVVNSSYYLEEKKAVFHAKVNLGVAIDLDQGGLIVATIHDADGLRMIGLARQVRGAGRQGTGREARAGRCRRQYVHHHQSGTFRILHVGADHQRAQYRDPVDRYCCQAANGDHERRRSGHDRHPTHRLPRPDLGPPGLRWFDGGPVPSQNQREPRDMGLGTGTELTPELRAGNSAPLVGGDAPSGARLRTRWLGRMTYAEAWDLQRAFWEGRVEGRSLDDYLLLLEHPHTYTVGRNGDRSNMLMSDEGLEAVSAELFFVDRGGDITYHGPGQLVGYPVVALADSKRIKRYVHRLEEVLIGTLAELGVEAWSDTDYPGVWTQRGKVAAIGVRVARGVTMHGFALNVNPDLTYFSHINPCGITDRAVTSITELLGRPVTIEEVVGKLIPRFATVFAYDETRDATRCVRAAVKGSLAGSK